MSQRKGSTKRPQGDKPLGYSKHKEYLGNRESIIAVSKREDVLPDEELGIIGSSQDPKDHIDIQNKRSQQNSEKTNEQVNFQDMIKQRQIEVQKRLASIQKQVEQQTMELEQQRQKNKFVGLPQEIFKPYKRNKDGKIVEDGPGGVQQILSLQSPDPRKYTSNSTMHHQNQSLFEIPNTSQFSDLQLQQQRESAQSLRNPNQHHQWTENEPSVIIQDSDDDPNSNIVQKPINTSDFVSGGLQPYRQSQHFTQQQIKQNSDNCLSSRKSEVNKNRDSRGQKFQNNIEERRSSMGLKKQASQMVLTNIYDKEFETQPLQSVKNQYSYRGNEILQQDDVRPSDMNVRNEIVSGRMDNVVLHPQDRKRLGLEITNEFESSQQSSQRQVNQSQRSIRSPRKTLQTQRSLKVMSPSQQSTMFADGSRQSLAQMKSSKLLENYVSDIDQTNNANRRIEKCSKNQNIANMKSIRNMINNSNTSNKNDDSLEELPSPEATPIRMQQREFIKDFRAPEAVINMQQIKDSVDSDPDDTQIIDQKLAQMKSNDEKMIHEKKLLLKLLIEEEQNLFRYANDNLENIQNFENSRKEDVIESEDEIEIDYKAVVQRAGINKLRVMFFVRQLQISQILTSALIRVFVPSLLQKFQIKFQHVCTNIHQNFLLMIDMILKELFMQTQANIPYDQLNKHEIFALTTRNANIIKTNEYQYLRQITDQKLRNKEKHSKTLTSFRQNNEVNIQNLKKIVKYVIDSYTQDCVAFKILAFDIQEIMKHHLSNIIANLNISNFQHLTESPFCTISYINSMINQRVNLLVGNRGGTVNDQSSFQKIQYQSNAKIIQSNQPAIRRGKSNIKGVINQKSVLQQSSIINQNSYGGNITNGSDQNSPSQGSPTKLRMNDLINSGQGVLANRKSPLKRSGHNDSIISGGKHNLSIQSNNENKVRDKHLWSNNFLADAQPGSPNFGVKLIKPDSKLKPGQDSLQVPQNAKNRQFLSNSALGMAAATKKITELQKRHGSGPSKSPLKISTMSVTSSQHNYPSPTKSLVTKKYGYGSQSSYSKSSRPGSRQEIGTSKPVNQTTGQTGLRRQNSNPGKLQQQQQPQNTIPRKNTLQNSSSKQRLEAKHRNLVNQKQNVQNSSQFMLPETLNFIRQQQNMYNDINNNNQSPFLNQPQMKSNQPKASDAKSGEMNENIKSMLTNIQNQNIVNINKSINFYGPVINHVYSSGTPATISEAATPEYFQQNLSKLQHLREDNDTEFDENNFIDEQFQNDIRGTQTSIKKSSQKKKEDSKIQSLQRKTYYEIQRAKNRSQNSYSEPDVNLNINSAATPFTRKTGKMTINQYLNNSRSTKNLPQTKPNTIKGSMIEPYVEQVEQHSVKTSILSQPSQQFNSPSKFGARKMSGGSGIGTGTKNLAIRQNQLALQRSGASKKSFLAGSTNIESFSTPQIDPMGKTAELKMNFPPQIVPPRNVQTSMSEAHDQIQVHQEQPRPSVLVQNSYSNKMQNLFQDDDDIESHQFENPPKPIQFNKTKDIQNLQELSEFEQLEAEIAQSDRYPVFQTAPDMRSDRSDEREKEVKVQIMESSPESPQENDIACDDAPVSAQDDENAAEEPIIQQSGINKEEISFQIDMFENNAQTSITPHDRELKSNDSNEFQNLEKHVDADFSEIMLKEAEQQDDEFMFDKSHKTPTRQTQQYTSLTKADLEFETRQETDPRNNKIRLSMRNSTVQESNNLTIPRNKAKYNKRMFFGEYDATAEEEQSLVNSQIANRDPAAVSNFMSSNNGSPGIRSPGTQSNSFSPAIKVSSGDAQISGRPSLIKLQEIRSQYESSDNQKPNSAAMITSKRESINDIELLEDSPSTPSIEKLKDQLLKEQYETNLETVCNNFEQEIDEAESPIRLSLIRESQPEALLETFQNQQAPQQIHTEENEELEEKNVQEEVDRPETSNTSYPPEEPQEEENDSQHQADLDEQAQIDLEFRQLRELVTIPYLPDMDTVEPSRLPKRRWGGSPYTLVLDLDETLIHFEIDETVDPEIEEPGYYLIRPGCIKFLNQLSEYYEVVVFTAAMPDYADWILDNVDRAGNVSHRLYRQHTTPHEDYAIKDLKNLGRDLSKTIIIDNLAENFNYTTPLNGIWVESWYDDMDDTVLSLLIPFLKEIVINQLDVRTVLTEHIKETFLYGFLDEQKTIPPVMILVEEDVEYNKAQAELQEQSLEQHKEDEQQE